MKTSEVLKAADALLSDESKWTKDASARDASGEKIVSTDKNAKYFCVFGAITRAARGYVGMWQDALRAIEAVAHREVSDFNDDPDTTFPAVKAAFARAIAHAEKQEAADATN